jgi:hypothetical protein
MINYFLSSKNLFQCRTLCGTRRGYPHQCGNRRCDIHGVDPAVNGLRRYARAHENNRHMGVIAPGGTVHGCDRPLIEKEPVGFLDDVDITGAGNVLIVPYLRNQRTAILLGKPATARRKHDPVHIGQCVGHGMLDFYAVDICRSDFFVVKVEVGPVEKTDNFIDTEVLPDLVGHRNDFVRIEASGFETQFAHILRHIGHAVVRGKHYQRVFEPNRFIDEGKQIRQGAIQLYDHIFIFKAGWPEEVVDRIHTGKADRQIIRDVILTQLFMGHDRFGKIEGELIANRADNKPGVEQFVVGLSERVGKDPSVSI